MSIFIFKQLQSSIVSGVVDRGSGSAPFTPVSLSGLAAWYDASDSATVTQSSNLVSQWNDKSGNARHVAQGNGSFQPTYDAGNKWILYNATNQSLFRNEDLALQSMTIFSVGMIATSPNYGSYFITQGNDGSSWGFRASSAGDGANPMPGFKIFGGNNSFSDSIALSTDYIFTCGRNSGTGFIYGYRNGVLKHSTTVVNTVPAATFYNVGSDANGMRLREEIVYNRDLTTSEKNQVGNYLAAKWGISYTNIP